MRRRRGANIYIVHESMSCRDSTYEIHKLVESSEHSRDFPSRIELDTEALVQILLQFRRLHFPSCHHDDDDDDDQPPHLQTTKSAGGRDGETKNERERRKEGRKEERKKERKEGGCNQSGVCGCIMIRVRYTKKKDILLVVV